MDCPFGQSMSFLYLRIERRLFVWRSSPQETAEGASKIMNWEVILWTCITVGTLFVICMLVAMIFSARNMKKNREAMAELQQNIQLGASIMFAGGIYGKIVKIKDDVIDVEVSKGVVIKISRYSIQSAS